MIAVGHQLPVSMKQFTDAADAENLNRNTFIKNNVKYIFLFRIDSHTQLSNSWLNGTKIENLSH